MIKFAYVSNWCPVLVSDNDAIETTEKEEFRFQWVP